MVDVLYDGGYTPLGKSWMNRVGVLDLVHGKLDTVDFLEKQPRLGSDLMTLYTASVEWLNDKKEIHVKGSRTLLIFLKFANWKYGHGKIIVPDDDLLKRGVCDNPDVINWSIEDLFTLEEGTSQWPSAFVLLGPSDRRMDSVDQRLFDKYPKFRMSFETLYHWHERHQKGERWDPRVDETLSAQAMAFLEMYHNGSTSWRPKEAEDYCFARAFGLTTPEEGMSRWPQMVKHESSRVVTMEKALEAYGKGLPIDVNDHRVLYPIVMKARIEKRSHGITNLNPVEKSWPLEMFMRLLEDAPNLGDLVKIV